VLVVATGMEFDEPSYPTDIRLLRAEAVMMQAGTRTSITRSYRRGVG
jgi:hypothetical protein